MYTLSQVFDQAKAEDSCGILDAVGYEARVDMGIKIVRCRETEQVSLLNTTIRKSYYAELNPKEYDIFKEKGWRIGLYFVSLSNSRRKLGLVEKKIQIEINGKNNPKQIQKLKASRERHLERYREVSLILNEINNG